MHRRVYTYTESKAYGFSEPVTNNIINISQQSEITAWKAENAHSMNSPLQD